jgi:hypothetical protein
MLQKEERLISSSFAVVILQLFPPEEAIHDHLTQCSQEHPQGILRMPGLTC